MHVDYRLTLRRVTDALLLPDTSPEQWQQASEQLYDLLISAAQFEPDTPAHKADLFLSSGKALAPAWAAMCIKDFYRTRQFILGLKAAIETLSATMPGTRLHILYAGTGPFAPLALPLTTLFAPETIQFTLLEINPDSVKMLKQTWASFFADSYIREILCTDATTYKASQPVHIVVSETMQQALQEEPQVAITANLAPQIAPGGILIPEKISISAGLYNFQNTLKDQPEKQDATQLTPVMYLSIDQYASEYPEIIVDIPEEAENGCTQFCLFTEIRVFGDIVLQTDDSGLTQPKILLSASTDGKFHTRKMRMQYVSDRKPGFRTCVISDT